VNAFFGMSGLGLAMPIEDGIVHHFMGALFSHQTCLCVCKRQVDGWMSASNLDNQFILVGWGSSGGSREVKEASQEAGQSALTELTEASQQATQSALTEDSDVAAMPGSNTGHKLCLKTNGNVKQSRTCGMMKHSKVGCKRKHSKAKHCKVCGTTKHCKVRGSTKHSKATVVVV
jgi:hypothetical protein